MIKRSLKCYIVCVQCQLIFYCDLDGVLTDFEKHLMLTVPASLPEDSFWKNLPDFSSIDELRAHLDEDWYKMTASLPQTFWEYMPWMHEGKSLWKYLESYPRIVLSTPQEFRWVNSLDNGVGFRYLHNSAHKEVETGNFETSFNAKSRGKILIDDQIKMILDRSGITYFTSPLRRP